MRAPNRVGCREAFAPQHRDAVKWDSPPLALASARAAAVSTGSRCRPFLLRPVSPAAARPCCRTTPERSTGATAWACRRYGCP